MICPMCGRFVDGPDEAPEPEQKTESLDVFMARAHVAWAKRHKPWLLKPAGA